MVPKYLNIKDNKAYIRDFDLCSLTESYGTPLMVFDEVELRENIDEFLNEFKSDKFNTLVVYASKAFLCPYIVNIVLEKGLFIDAVSLGDLFVIKKSNFPMNKVIFHGNNKSTEELEFAVKEDVTIVVDNYLELQNLTTICKNLNKTCNTMFRVNPGIEAHTHKFIQTSLYTSKFGESIYDEQMVSKIMDLYIKNPLCKLKGFHSHIGSQIHDVEPFILNVKTMLEFTNKVVEKYNYPLDSLNLGGGFGIQYYHDEDNLNMKLSLNNMIEYLEKMIADSNQKITNLYIEPGRSILGNSCVSLYKVGGLKETYGHKNYLFIDGGMTDNIRPALYDAKYECSLANKMNNANEIVCDVAGKCCESGDVLIHDANLPKSDAGDILMVYSTGAYTYSMSSNYNNMLKPMVLFLNDKVNIACKRQNLDDLMLLF